MIDYTELPKKFTKKDERLLEKYIKKVASHFEELLEDGYTGLHDKNIVEIAKNHPDGEGGYVYSGNTIDESEVRAILFALHSVFEE